MFLIFFIQISKKQYTFFKKTIQTSHTVNISYMKCRVCNFSTKLIYVSPKLPEYFWPSLKKTKTSNCKVFGCNKCYSIQLQNFSKKRIQSFYGDESFNIITSENHQKRINIIKKYYGLNFFRKKNIIDIGGGVNPIMNNKNVDIYDFKISKDNNKSFKGNIFSGDIEKIKLKKKYDIVFLLHTLEHLPNPLKAINLIKDILNKRGKIFIEIPNFDYFIKKMPHYAVFHQHLNMYDLKNLKNLFNFAELTIEKIFLKKDVIFCSVYRNKKSVYKNKKIDETLKINLVNKIKILKFNLKKQKKLLKKSFKKNVLHLYGAGGSTSLLLFNHRFFLKKIVNIYDNEKRKHNKLFPGTKKLNRKPNLDTDHESVSFYKIKKKNNTFLNF